MDTQKSGDVSCALAQQAHGSIPALTLWRPWADWVMLGWKTVETRTHARLRSLGNQPTRLAIHAAEKWDENALDAARKWLTEEQTQVTQTVIRPMPVSGHVLGTVLVVGFALLDERDEKQALIECRSVTRYGLKLVNPTPLAMPLKTTGRQGIFRVDLPSDSADERTRAEAWMKSLKPRRNASVWKLNMMVNGAAADEVSAYRLHLAGRL